MGEEQGLTLGNAAAGFFHFEN